MFLIALLHESTMQLLFAVLTFAAAILLTALEDKGGGKSPFEVDYETGTTVDASTSSHHASMGIPSERKSSNGFFYKRFTKLCSQIERLEASIVKSGSATGGTLEISTDNDKDADTVSDEIQRLSDYGKLADMYAEKELKWHSGGGRAALKYYSLAIDGLGMMLLRQQHQDTAAGDGDGDDELSGLVHLRRINVHWMLHSATLLSYFGEGLRAIGLFKDVLNELTKNHHMGGIYGDSLQIARDKGEIMYNIAQTYLNVENDFEAAVGYFNLTLMADKCKFNAYPPLVAGLKQIDDKSSPFYMGLSGWEGLGSRLAALATEAVSYDSNDEKYVLNRRYCPLNSFGGGGKVSSSSLFAEAVASEEERVAYLYYAMFEVNDGLRNYREAFDSLKKCNDILTKYNPYDSRETLDVTTNILGTFHDKYWPTQRDDRGDSTGSIGEVVGSPSYVPVFIVGFLRSGSTLLESMLQMHPGVATIGEDSPLAYELDQLAADIEKLLKSSVGDGNDWKAFETAIAERASRVLSKMWELAESALEGHVTKDLSSVLRILDKNLYNYRNIGLIHLLFPHARVIHIHRDPMDTVFGCYKRIFTSAGNAWSTDMGTLATEYSSYLSVMDHFYRTAPSGVLHSVRYEELVANPQRVLREVVTNALSLEWDDAVLAHASIAGRRSVHTASNLQVRLGVYDTSVGNWRRYSAQLLPLRNELLKAMRTQQLPSSRSAGIMFDVGNWQLDPAYDYKRMLRRSSSTELGNTSKASVQVNDAATGNWSVAMHLSSVDTFQEPLQALDAAYPNSILDDDIYSVRDADKDWVLARIRLLIKKSYHLLGSGKLHECLYTILDAEAYYDFIVQYPSFSESDGDVTIAYGGDIYTLLGDAYSALYSERFDINSEGENALFFNRSIENFKNVLALGETRNDYSVYYKIGQVYKAQFYHSNRSSTATSDQSAAPLKTAARGMLRVLSRRLGEGILMSDQEAVELFEKVANGTAKAQSHKVSDKTVALRLQNRQLYWAVAEVTHLAEDYTASNGFFRKAHEIEVEYLKRLPGTLRHNIDSAATNAKSVLVSFHKGFYSFRDIRNAPKIGLMTKRPVFVVGFLGSGTDLLDTLLSNHPAVVNVNRNGESVVKLYESRLMDSLKDLFVTNAGESMNENNYLSTLKKLQAIVNRKAKRILDIYKNRLDLIDINASSVKVLDGSWDNYKLIGLIHLLFPRALIINVVRDPLDTLLESYHRSDLNFTESMFTLDSKGLSSEYVIYLRLAHHFGSFLPRELFVSVSYEKILLNPVEELREIFVARLHLPFNKEHEDAVLTPSMMTTIRRRVRMVGVWKKYKDADIVKRLKNDVKKAGLPSLMRQDMVPQVIVGKNVYKMNFLMDYNFSYNIFKRNLTYTISHD